MVPFEKKAGFHCSRFNGGSSFISQDEEMSESPVKALENVVGPCLIWTAGLKSLDTSRGMRSSMLQKVAMPDPC